MQEGIGVEDVDDQQLLLTQQYQLSRSLRSLEVTCFTARIMVGGMARKKLVCHQKIKIPGVTVGTAVHLN